MRAGRNIAGVTIIPAALINPYEIIKADKIVLMNEAIAILDTKDQKTVAKKVIKKPVKLAKKQK